MKTLPKVYLYVEGGGTPDQHIRLQEAFRILLLKSGFGGRMPRIVACGGRDQTFQAFKKALSHRSQADIAILLIDSEDPFSSKDSTIDAPIWQHLKARDKWEKPNGVADNQVALMVTSMETWISADHAALKAFFGPKLKEEALLLLQDLESRNRKEVLNALEKATEDCGKDRSYGKGKKSFQVLATVNPNTLAQHLPHFNRFLAVMRHHLHNES